MTTELRRFVVPLTVSQLGSALANPTRFETEPVGIIVDLDQVRNVFDAFARQNVTASSLERAQLDRLLAVPLHTALTDLSRRSATDMHMWHWLCVSEFRDFVWYRWYGRIPQDLAGIISPSLAERFLGAPTLHGISRNALARLWWCAESLYSDADGYDLACVALASQDFFQGIFEREFGLYLPAAKACVRVLRDSSEDERREATKVLNHYFTTVAAEALSENQIVHDLLSRYVRQA